MEDLLKELEQLHRLVARSLAEEMQDWMKSILSSPFSQASLLSLAESLGINLSGDRGATAQQNGFDP